MLHGILFVESNGMRGTLFASQSCVIHCVMCGGGGEVLPYLGLRVRAAGQGVIFWPRCPKHDALFGLPLS